MRVDAIHHPLFCGLASLGDQGVALLLEGGYLIWFEVAREQAARLRGLELPLHIAEVG